MSNTRQDLLGEIYMMSEGRHDLVDKRIKAENQEKQIKPDLCRESFEQWVRRVNGTWADKCLEKNPEGQYRVMSVSSEWAVWQAAWLQQGELVKQLADALVDAKFLIDRHREPETKNFIQEHITGPKVQEVKNKISTTLSAAKEHWYE